MLKKLLFDLFSYFHLRSLREKEIRYCSDKTIILSDSKYIFSIINRLTYIYDSIS